MMYGVILGLAYFIIVLIFYMAGLLHSKADFSMLVNNLGILVAGLIITGISYRKKIMGGVMTYGKALVLGILTSIFTSFIYAFLTFLLYAVIDPDLLQNYFSFVEQSLYDAQEQLQKFGMTERADEMIAGFDKIVENTTALSFSYGKAFNVAIWGAVVSLITAFIVRKKKKDDNFDEIVVEEELPVAGQIEGGSE